MSRVVLAIALGLIFFSASGKKNVLYFLENKGQVADQHHKQRTDILFYGSTANLSFYLRQDGISYQLYRGYKSQKKNAQTSVLNLPEPPMQDSGIFQRLDISWIGANKVAEVKASNVSEGKNNYYLAHCPDGIIGVKSYAEITYKNIYPDIDLKYYQVDGFLKYDYIVAPGGRLGEIRLQVKGADAINLNKDGSLTIKTFLGDVTEDAPIVYQEGKKIPAKWLLQENVLSFAIESYDKTKPLLIDPLVRNWGTYFGGNSNVDRMRRNQADSYGNIYVSGITQSTGNIATSGAFQVTISGMTDFFLTKFDSSGNRKWATYYGGSADEHWGFCKMVGEEVLLFGGTTSMNFPVTPGCYQPNFGGGFTDGAIVKFDTAGMRILSTFYGGNGDDIVRSIIQDSATNYFLAGITSTVNGMSTFGAHQALYGGNSDGFLSKFDSAFNRIWSTYYGGSNTDQGDLVIGPDNKLYFFGVTYSSNGISTIGSFQQNFAGGSLPDAFVSKFDTSGIRKWATYYGTPGIEMSWDCKVGDSNFVYLGGQQAAGGFLLKLDTSGGHVWHKAYPADIRSIAITSSHQIIITGVTTSGTGIATPGAYQTISSGNLDGFLAEVNPAGAWTWGTYYGGSGNNEGFDACTIDSFDNVYLCGVSNSPNNISSPGSYQSVNAGGNDGILVKFSPCLAPALGITGNIMPCTGASTTYVANTNVVGGTIQWKLNGNNVGTNSGSYTYMPSNGDLLQAVVTTPATGCYASSSVTSNTLSITLSPPTVASLTITPSANNTCAGIAIAFTANTNITGGTIQWKVNGTNTGSNSTTHTYVPANGDIVTAELTVPATGCYSPPSVVSNTITMLVQPIISPVVTITGPASVPTGQPVTITANVVSAGSSYSLNWKNNNNWFATTTVPVVTYTKSSGIDTITAMVTATSLGCYDSTTSNTHIVSVLDGIIETMKAEGIEVYPNPFEDVLTVKGLNAKDKLTLADITGRVIYTWEASSQIQTFTIDGLIPGHYILKIINKKGELRVNVPVVKK